MVVSPFLRTVQTGAFLVKGIFDSVQEAQEKPLIFVAKNLCNRLSGGKVKFFDVGTLATVEPDAIISNHCDDVIGSYHANKLGETALVHPGPVEEKPTYRWRVAQGIIDIIVAHLRRM